MERDLLAGRREAEIREAPRELLERERGFEAAERGADAEVDAAAERERAAGVRALGVERVRVGEDVGVAAGGREPEEELRALGQVDAAELTGRVVTRRHTGTDGSNRSTSSTAPAIRSGLGTSRPSARGPRAAAARSCRSGCSSSRAPRS